MDVSGKALTAEVKTVVVNLLKKMSLLERKMDEVQKQQKNALSTVQSGPEQVVKHQADRQRYFTPKQVSNITGFSIRTVRRAISAGHLPVSLGGSAARPAYRVSETDIDNWMDALKAGPKKKNRCTEKPPPGPHY
jgi:hypothetical protein